jgi:ABC-type transport system involved in multi-copper enzyme maturation permease subunit
MTTLTIARLTFKESQRRKILWIGLLMGVAFIGLFSIGLHYIILDFEKNTMSDNDADLVLAFLTMAGLLVTNFLVIMLAVLLSVASVSGEIDDHTIDSLITKPIHRWEIIMGKWVGFAVMILGGVLLLPGGVLLAVYLRTGFTLNNIPAGLGLMYLEGLVMLTISILGGTRLSTMANGAMAFMWYGLAFIGSWVEQIGGLFGNETAVDIGIVSSLISPTEVLWRMATLQFQPELSIGLDNFVGPFGVSSQPNGVMLWYAIGFMGVMLGLALWGFSRRDL